MSGFFSDDVDREHWIKENFILDEGALLFQHNYSTLNVSLQIIEQMPLDKLQAIAEIWKAAALKRAGKGLICD